MIDPIKNMVVILKNEDLRAYSGKAFLNFIRLIFTKDMEAGKEIVVDLKEILFNIPNILFWDKMKRFLYGTFHNFDEQVQFSERFGSDNQQYEAFVKRQIQLIDQIDEETKIEYFAALTRALLLGCIQDVALYFKLAKFLTVCTTEELEYIKAKRIDACFENSIMVSALYQYGLVSAKDAEVNGSGKYGFSDFAKALKQNCLNFDEGCLGIPRIGRYEEMKPIEIEPPTMKMGSF